MYDGTSVFLSIPGANVITVWSRNQGVVSQFGVELPMCSSSLPKLFRVDLGQQQDHVLLVCRKEIFDDEQTFAQVMRACEV